MREDMAKVIVERPRREASGRLKGRLRGNWEAQPIKRQFPDDPRAAGHTHISTRQVLNRNNMPLVNPPLDKSSDDNAA